MGELFGTDGIRSKVGDYPMTTEMIEKIGAAAASLFAGNRSPKIVIGRDTRESGESIEKALISGICKTGTNVLPVGILPTPGIAYLTSSMKADAGIVISASHNPYYDNGIKIFKHNGFKLSDANEDLIENIVFEEKNSTKTIKNDKFGQINIIEDAVLRYKAFLIDIYTKEYENLKGVKIVIDCANGATFQTAPQLFTELGADVIPLFIQPDGKNINDKCGSQHPETLIEKVLENKADIGLAFDGDGDRLIAVDEKGNTATGDQIIAVCARYLKKKGKLANNLAVTTVMSNMGLGIALKEMDINHSMAKVGDRYVLEEMQNKNAVLGGEDSGHMIFLDHHTTGDGMIAAIKLLHALKDSKKPFSEVLKVMDVFPQELINIDVKTKPEIDSVPEIKNIIQLVAKKLANKGRVLVRYSGTQPMCRVMVEGPTKVETSRYCKKIADVIEEVLG